MRLHRLLTAFAAALALGSMLVIPPTLLVLGIGNPLPDWSSLRTGQLDAPMLIHILACIVWVAWAQFTLGTTVEALAAVARRPVPRRVAIGQGLARTLVTVIATAIATGPVLSMMPAARAMPVLAVGPLHAPVGEAAESSPPPTPTPALPVYVVGSEPELAPSLWTIAESHLGNPLRWKEIWQLNRGSRQPGGRVFDDPNVIRLGWQLRLPADAVGVSALAPTTTDVTVAPGDTLSSIAQRDGAPNWQTVWAVNARRIEPGRERFTDPDLIMPGWTIAVPALGRETPPAMPANGHGRPHVEPAPASTRTSTPPSPALAPPQSSPEPSASADKPAPTHSATARNSRIGYPGLLTGGGLLAACAAAALAAHRQRQFARRRPGRMTAPPPPELVPVEKAIAVAGRPAIASVEFLDLALRDLAMRLADEGSELPDIVAAGLHDDHLELVLVRPGGEPPDPWDEVGESRWTLSRSAELDPRAAGHLAPYPCLVSAGYTGDGTEWLLDLEHARVVQLDGDPARRLALARFMAAELALNNWSDDISAELAGFGSELVTANPSRLNSCDDPASSVERLVRSDHELTELAELRGVDVLSGRLRGGCGDAWMPQLLFVGPEVLDDQAGARLTELTKQISGQSRRSPVAVVLIGPSNAANDWMISVASDGRLLVPGLQLDGLIAHGLTETEARDVAAAIALARDAAADVAVPASEGDEPGDAVMDRAGALLPDLTSNRNDGTLQISDATSDASSVLPLAISTYLTHAATTTEDIDALAPAVPADTRIVVEAAVSGLDRDVADWHDPECRRPKLRLLGPVCLTAHGQLPKPGWGGICTEAIAYLALHPRGVSADQFAADLWPDRDYDSTSRYVQNIASAARKWLGTDPLTGDTHMPWLSKSDVDSYRVAGLLVDADLFRQLRARGTARGADGSPDLVAALELVSGRPLDGLRRAGYSWLEPGEDTLYEGMIEEVAHIVATHALADDDSRRARWASEIVLAIDATNERALCDLATSYMIDGAQPELDATVQRLRDLDDLSDRTYDVMCRNGWLATRR